MKLPKIKMPEIKMPELKKKRPAAETPERRASSEVESATAYENYEDLYIWEEEFDDEGADEGYSGIDPARKKRGSHARTASAFSEVKLPGFEELLEEENFRKLWFGEIVFAMLLSFAAVLIGFAG